MDLVNFISIRLQEGLLIMLKIREITHADNADVKKIIQDSLKTLGLAIKGTAYFDPQLGQLYEFYRDLENAQYWVVELAGEIVGGIGIAPFNQELGICELQKLYLVPAVQGLGISKKLMETALTFARSRYTSCYLETTHNLKAACNLYEKFGFKLLTAPIAGSAHCAMDAWYLKSLRSPSDSNF